MRATLYQHPSAKANLQPPPPASDQALAPDQIDYSLLSREEQERRCHAIDEVGILVAEFGVETVQRWIRYHAWMQGRRI